MFNEEASKSEKKKNVRELLPWFLVLFVIFAIPAVIVRIAMEDVPKRSEIKVVTTYQKAADLVEGTFRRHRERDPANKNEFMGILEPIPLSSKEWIVRLNPMGRLAPGGGPAVLLVANPLTGALGLRGDQYSVTLTIPAYRNLKSESATIYADNDVGGRQ